MSAPSDVVVEIHRTFDGLDEAWERLIAASPLSPVFLTWEWATTWWRYYGEGRDLFLMVAKDSSGNVVGLAPLMIDVRRLAGVKLRRLAFIGTGEIYPAHLDVLALPEYQEPVVDAIGRALRAHTDEWDVLEFISLRTDSLLAARHLMKGVNRTEGATMPCPYVFLPEDWETYAAERLSSKAQKNLAYYERRLERDFPGEVSYELASDRQQVDETITQLKHMHENRWQAQGDSTPFSNERFVAFHREIALHLLERDWLRLFRLRVGDDIIAVNYCYKFGGVFYGYQKGFDEAWGKYSPGQVLQKFVIASAIGEGYCVMDMLHGAQGHKSMWVEDVRHDRQVRFAHGVKGQAWLLRAELVDGAVTVGRRLLSESLRDRLNRLRSSLKT